MEHPNIIKYIGACTKYAGPLSLFADRELLGRFPNLAVVMEFAPFGSLTSLLKKDAPLDWKLRLKIASDIGASNGVIRADIHCRILS